MDTCPWDGKQLVNGICPVHGHVGFVAPGVDVSNSYTTNVTNTTTVPSGIICMWSGSTSSIPQGWLLCDGTNGTPNLRDRFIVGAGSSYAVGAAAGSATHLHSSGGAHSHGGLTGNGDGSTHFNTSGSGNNGQNLTHKHSISADGGHTHDQVSNLPPYYALAYIMKA